MRKLQKEGGAREIIEIVDPIHFTHISHSSCQCRYSIVYRDNMVLGVGQWIQPETEMYGKVKREPLDERQTEKQRARLQTERQRHIECTETENRQRDRGAEYRQRDRLQTERQRDRLQTENIQRDRQWTERQRMDRGTENR